MILADVFIEERCKLNQLLVAELNVRQSICVQEGSQVRMSGLNRVVPRLVEPRHAVKAHAIVDPHNGHQAMGLRAHRGTVAVLSLAGGGRRGLCGIAPSVQSAARSDPLAPPPDARFSPSSAVLAGADQST